MSNKTIDECVRANLETYFRDLLKRLLKPGDHALLKASHGMALERILA